MIVIRLRDVAKKSGIENAYQLQKLTGITEAQAYKLWKEKWGSIYPKTLNTLCNALKCTPNDLLEFTPDEELSEKI